MLKTLLAAGSEARADLDYVATPGVGDFLSKPHRGLDGNAEDNALGRIPIVVYAPRSLGARGEKVLRALRDGHGVATTGPLLGAGFGRNGNGSLDDLEHVGIGQEVVCPLKSQPPSRTSLGEPRRVRLLRAIRLIVGTHAGEVPPVEVPVLLREAF